MTEQRWTTYDTIVTYLTSQSIVDNANKLGAAIDFTASGTDRKLYMDIEISIDTVDLSVVTNPAIYFWMLPRTDGTNFEDGDDTVDPARQPDGIIALREFNGVQRVFVRRALTTPDQAKLLFENQAGATIVATIKYNIYSEQSV